MSSQTMLESLCKALSDAARHSTGEAAPTCVLWSDPKGEWLPLVDTLRSRLPQLLIHGEYDLEKRTGPSIWLRCALARTLPEVTIPDDLTPILYLPKISRQTLRAGKECPTELQPLVALLYRGTVWTQKNGRDWSIEAMLVSKDSPGIGLDVAKDERTKQSMMAALSVLADTPVSRLAGRRLEAEDFDKLMIGDHPRDLLRWMSDPVPVRKELEQATLDGGSWHAFCSRCRDDFRFDPEADGELVAGEKLGMRETATWEALWGRFCESPKAYPGIPELLRRSKPTGKITYEQETWPDVNESEESTLRSALENLKDATASSARDAIHKLEQTHGVRRTWVWAKLGWAPLAIALEHLVHLADRSAKQIGGDSREDLAKQYAESGYLVDDAALAALGSVRTAADSAAVGAAVRSLYLPWLDQTAVRLQEVWDEPESDRVSESPAGTTAFADDDAATGVYAVSSDRSAYGTRGTVSAHQAVKGAVGCCLLFADGLRYDLAQRLSVLLGERKLMVSSQRRWAALPSVTATAKPAASPVSQKVRGVGLPDSFAPSLAEDDSKSLTFARLQSLLKGDGYQILAGDDVGDPAAPKARAWCEFGEIDKRGHSMQGKLASVVDEQIELIAERVCQLLDAGWREVRIVTDHGWLLMPGGLPKEELPHYLTEAKWARCATIKGESNPQVPKAVWHWNQAAEFATAPGVRCFKSSHAYAHGGISLQECLIADLSVTLQSQAPKEEATITNVDWKGLRVRVSVDPPAAGLRVDLRSKPNDSTTSLCDGGKPLDGASTVTLFVEDDDLEGSVVAVTVFNAAGQLIAKQNTTVGGE
ncbi:MAG: BREX-1 system phosphatase PglZ type B [Aureliella sp.]